MIEAITFFALWIMCGVLTVLLIWRPEDDVPRTLIVGGALGPLTIPSALANRRGREHRPPWKSVEPGIAREGDVDVLVAINAGSPVTRALKVGRSVAGDRLGRFALVTSSCRSSLLPMNQIDEEEAIEALHLAASFAEDLGPEKILLSEPLETALAAFAHSGNYDIVVVSAADHDRRMIRRMTEEVARARSRSLVVVGEDLEGAGRSVAERRPSP